MTIRFLPILLVFVSALAGAEHWDIQYQYKQLDSILTLNDLAFPSANRGIACGFTLDRKGRDHPFLVATSDGGTRWTEVPVKDTGISLFFLDDSNGWMVTAKGLWYTAESGRSWTHLKAPAGFLKVWFLDRQHGFGVGLDKNISETTDGGDTWKRLAILSEISGDPKFTTFGEITFRGARGSISGWNIPPRKGGPDWMEGDKQGGQRQWPNLSITVDTTDGGKTWSKTEASIFGQVTRLDLGKDGLGVGLIEFHDAFEYPSEIYAFNTKVGRMRRIYRETDRAITDIKQIPGTERVIIAGFEAAGTIYRSPIPGKLKVIATDDLKIWYEMEVDYRAVAKTAMLAAPDATHAWIGTDTGMILKLIND